MWVQEGSDCKDADEEPSPIQLLLARYNISTTKQQSVTQTNIPMITAAKKAMIKKMNEPVYDQERKEEEEPEISEGENKEKDIPRSLGFMAPIPAPVPAPEVPRSHFPGGFSFQSAAIDEKDEWNLVTPSPPAMKYEPKKPRMSSKTRRVHPSVFIDNLDDAKDEDEDEQEAHVDFDADEDGVFPRSAFFDAASALPDSDTDCAISETAAKLIDDTFGMKFADASPARVPLFVEFSVESSNLDDTEAEQDEEEETAEVRASRFDGLEVKAWADWEHCVDFMRGGGLIVAEVYSKVFGPSLPMYPFIADIVRRKTLRGVRIEFVRLSLRSLKGIELVREAIVDYDRYAATPIPLFFFLKNGKKVGQIDGAKPKELSALIDRFASREEPRGGRTLSETAQQTPQRFESILAKQRARAKQSKKDADAESASWCYGFTESIRSLIERAEREACAPSTATTLWKNEMVLVD